MAGKGTFTAYQQAYADKPVDVAGSIADGFGKAVTAVQDRMKEQKAEKEVLRKEKLSQDEQFRREDREDKLNTDKINREVFGDYADKIKLQEGAPPRAEQGAVDAGDEMNRIIQNYPPGPNRQSKLSNVVRKTQMFINSVTAAHLKQNPKPQTSTKNGKTVTQPLPNRSDNFFVDGGFGATEDNLLTGNYTNVWENGEMFVVGTGQDKKPIKMTVKEFSTKMNTPVNIPEISLDSFVTRINTLKKDWTYNINNQGGQDALNAAINNDIESTFNTQNTLASSRYIYNNAENLGMSVENKVAMLEIGKLIQGGARFEDLVPEQQKLFNDIIGKAKKLFRNSVERKIPLPTIKAEKAVVGKVNKDYIQTTSDILDKSTTPAKAEEMAANVAKGDFSDFVDAGLIIDVNYEGTSLGRAVGTSSTSNGTVTIEGEDYEFSAENPLEEVVKKYILDQNDPVAAEFYSPAKVVTGSNYGLIADKLAILHRDNPQATFSKISNGVKIKVGSKSINVKLEGLSDARRAATIKYQMTLLNK